MINFETAWLLKVSELQIENGLRAITTRFIPSQQQGVCDTNFFCFKYLQRLIKQQQKVLEKSS
jgi:hypothetical protein